VLQGLRKQLKAKEISEEENKENVEQLIECRTQLAALTDQLQLPVLLPYPSNCSRFFMRSNGVPIEMHCPAGLHFNDQLKVCDWPQNANCVKGKLFRLYLTLDFVFSRNNDAINLILTKLLLLLLLLSLALQPTAI
jgi:hypothetical protein